ncbi:trichohyalin-like [Danio aesculapii]|uniref:trichohyalin-like n=1 Tax=Danio aesculapii TaxID=1142201 RepID=UPI0024BF4268|nr:trichohyalin-like [Danio aesculapii]
MTMADWREERRSLSPPGLWSAQELDTDLGRRSFRHTLRSLSPLALSDLDFWDGRSFLKTWKSPAWSCVGFSGSPLNSKISKSTLGSQRHKDSLGIKRWSSASRLAPEGAPRSHSSAEDFELRAALEESRMKRAELVQRLREARGHLDAQTDLLRTKGFQLQQSKSLRNLLDIKHKQLSEAVKVLEQDKGAAEMSRFEDSRRRRELNDKVLQLELDILKMRSSLETLSTSVDLPSRTLPHTKDQILRERQKQAEMEIKKLREALRKAEEKTDELEYEKEHALKQLHSSDEHKEEAINKAGEMEQRLSSSIQNQAELEEQLNESRSRLGQMELEKDLFSAKMRRLEDNLNDLKVKLSGALMDKDRLLQEKAELYQKIQSLDLQLQREQRSKQGFSEQMSELHSELSQAKSQSSKQKMDTMLMKEELLSVKELKEKLSSDLTKATERLQVTLNQLHKLEAEKLIQTNQITALETERLQLIVEKEELRKTFDEGLHENNRDLGERCFQLKEQRDNLELENQRLQFKCQELEQKIQSLEVGQQHKKEEERHMRAEFEREKEELKKVAAHWNERWLDVAMTLCSTQEELDVLKRQQQEKDRVSCEDLNGELEEELLRLRNMLKVRDVELEELQSVLNQESQKSNNVQRLEKLLSEKEKELMEKDQDLKNLETQRITEKAEAQIKISALEQENFGHKGHLGQEVVRESSPESMSALLEESRMRAERHQHERDQALQKLFDLGCSQSKECLRENIKQKPATSDLAVDPNTQRRLVTEQLKSLFRERELCGERSSVFPRRPYLADNLVQNASDIKNWNAVVDVNHQGRETQTPEHDLQQGAANPSPSQISDFYGGSEGSEGGVEDIQPISVKHSSKTAQPK